MRKILPFLFLLAFILTFSFHLKAQKSNSAVTNNVFVEFLGSGLLGSINYELNISRINIRTGMGYNEGDYLFPTIISFTQPRGKILVLEYGIGVIQKIAGETRYYAKTEVNPAYEFFPTVTFGLKLQPNERGPWGRIAFTPILDLERGGEYYFFGQKPIIPIFPWAGISFGYAF